jgi:hypothetical protein
VALWLRWWSVVRLLRPACSRYRNFLWMALCLAGMCIRGDLAGVTSLVRTLGLQSLCYDRLLDFFHSSAMNPEHLSRLWTSLVVSMFPNLLQANGRLVLLADGLKIGKAGRKMPAVKKLKQVVSNTKPEFIFGHSCQAISVVACAEGSAFAVPLAARIHEGVVYSNRHRKTQPQKLLSLLDGLGIPSPVTLVADAYYACRSVARGLLAHNSHLVSRVRINAVAYWPPEQPSTRKRGRPRVYGARLKLRTVFDDPAGWSQAKSPVYDERDVVLRYRVLDLLWRPLGRMVRFVAVDHPTRGRIILICTDLTMGALEIVRLYGIRFKIELSFKQALRVIGTYAYHFWMSSMKPLNRHRSGDQYLHWETAEYREAVTRKILAYHRHIQLGVIAQGLLQYLAASAPSLVWSSFGSWLRTIRDGIPPSERVTALALRNALPEFLASKSEAAPLQKFLIQRIDPGRREGALLTG